MTPVPTNPHKILIADDDREHLLMLAFLLRKAGYQVISAFDAKHALQLAVEQAPDLLLLDIHLGDEDGYEVHERLQKIDELAQVPVIYLTGDSSNWVQTITTALGAHAVIRKPFNSDELLAVIRAGLKKLEVVPPVEVPRPVIPACESTDAYVG